MVNNRFSHFRRKRLQPIDSSSSNLKNTPSMSTIEIVQANQIGSNWHVKPDSATFY